MSAAGINKDMQRIRHFLRKGEVKVQPAAQAGSAILDGGERGRIAVMVQALAALQGAGELVREGGCVRLRKDDDEAGDSLGATPQKLATQTIMAGGEQLRVSVNLNESPLAMLYRRRDRDGGRLLSDAEFAAGERLRSDYERACIMPRLGANWEASVAGRRRASPGGGLADLTNAVISARRRVDAAIRAVGPELAGVLIDICCFTKGLEAVEAERCWPARSAKLLLKAALSALARHYAPPARPARMLHWGDNDFRPSVTP